MGYICSFMMINDNKQRSVLFLLLHNIVDSYCLVQVYIDPDVVVVKLLHDHLHEDLLEGDDAYTFLGIVHNHCKVYLLALQDVNRIQQVLLLVYLNSWGNNVTLLDCNWV